LESLLGHKPDRFILEGGAAPATALYLANEVARRAERLFISLQNLTDPPAGWNSKSVTCQQYLNHLSYQLYLMGRITNRSLGVPEESISTDPETGEVIVTTDANG
jgi:cob(I)alamin adenosyltransferase